MTAHDDKLVKKAQSMTAGITTSGIKQYDPIVLHDGHLIKVIATDATETLIQYDNGAQRAFSTYDLASFRDLGTFPMGTPFHRRTAEGNERLYIEHVTADAYIVEMTKADGTSVTETMTYADLIAWHKAGDKVDPTISLVPGTRLYVPKTPVPAAEVKPESSDTVSADKLDGLAEEANPFEDELQKALDAARAEIDDLKRQLRDAKADLLRQNTMHDTEMLTKNDQIDWLKENLAKLNPAPVCKTYRIERDVNQNDLNKWTLEGWNIDHREFTTGENFASKLNMILVRDLPASPAPKVAVTDEAIYGESSYIGSVPLGRTPAQPPMPANQTIIHQPTSRALTHNGPRDPHATQPVKVPEGDPVISEAFRRAQAVYDQHMAEGQRAVNQASRAFNQGA